jgi:hypothetical protein
MHGNSYIANFCYLAICPFLSVSLSFDAAGLLLSVIGGNWRFVGKSYIVKIQLFFNANQTKSSSLPSLLHRDEAPNQQRRHHNLPCLPPMRHPNPVHPLRTLTPRKLLKNNFLVKRFLLLEQSNDPYSSSSSTKH